MNSKTALSVAVALMMATSQLSFAQGNSNHDRDGKGNDRDRNEGRQHDNNGNSPKPERHDNRDFGRSHNQERNRGGRGVGPNHEYYRGDRIPVEYRHRQYVVDDWRGHHLYAPPQGYQWVQSGGDYLLVAVATGIIASILLSQ